MASVEYIIMPFIFVLVFILLSGKFLIKKLAELKVGQNIRDEGPTSHISKQGTPTMGGIIIIIPIIIATIIWGRGMRTYILLSSMLLFGLMGFIDDYVKVVNRRNLGLNVKQKLLIQLIFSMVLISYQYFCTDLGSGVYLPFFYNRIFIMGPIYIPFMILVSLGTVNAVNLTDGLDGLAAGVTAIVAVFFLVFGFLTKDSAVLLYSALIIAACLGFLVFNHYPAKVFMGDTGSMALGGLIIGISIISGLPFFIPIVGGIYFAEAISVLVQVFWFKRTGKRLLLMSPLHHHYEMKGWKETKVVKTFILACGVLVFIGILAII